jgi:hypothetical protein
VGIGVREALEWWVGRWGAEEAEDDGMGSEAEDADAEAEVEDDVVGRKV